MLRTRRKRLDRANEAATRRLAEIATSIEMLGDEDLLDLADIFKAEPPSPLAVIAKAEMARRGISL